MIGAFAVLFVLLAGATGGTLAAVAVSAARVREQSTNQMADGYNQSTDQMAEPASCATVGVQTAERPVGAGQVAGQEVGERARAAALPGGTRVLVGPRLDARSKIQLELGEGERWPPWVEDAEPGPAEVGGKLVTIARAGPGGVVAEALGQVRLEVRGRVAVVKMGRRAVDTLGGFEGWVREWLPALTDWLLGAGWRAAAGDVAGDCRSGGGVPPSLEALERVGWVVAAPDVAAEFLGLELGLDEHGARRWTSGATQTVVPSKRGDWVHWHRIGSKGDPMSQVVYRKSGHVANMRDGAGLALAERWRQAGWDGREPVTRVEQRPRGDALRLRARGNADGEVLVDMTRLSHCCDAEKLGMFWSYATKHFRLVVPETTAKGAERPARKCTTDPRWVVVQSAAGVEVSETLAQVKARKAKVRDDWHIRAQESVVRGLAEDVALDGVTDADEARELARGRASRWVDGVGWRSAWGRARAATQDLVEDRVGESGCGPPQVRTAAGAGRRSTGKEDFRFESAGAAQKGAM